MVFDQSLFQNSTYEFKNEIKAKPALGKFYLTRLIVNKIGKHHSSPPLTSSCTCAYLTVKNYEKLDKPLDMVWCNLISFTRDFCYREISTHLFFKGRRDALLDVGSQPLLTFIVHLLISLFDKMLFTIMTGKHINEGFHLRYLFPRCLESSFYNYVPLDTLNYNSFYCKVHS